MGKETLVKEDIEMGKELVRTLDKNGLEITSAFWLYLQDMDDWRLMLATILADTEGPIKVYTRILRILQDRNLPFDSISVISPNDSINKLLTSFTRTGYNLCDIRFTKNTINGVLIDDAYIYRLN